MSALRSIKKAMWYITYHHSYTNKAVTFTEIYRNFVVIKGKSGHTLK